MARFLAELKRRRAIEADMIIHDRYPSVAEKIAPAAISDIYARFVVPLEVGEVKKIGENLEKLGYIVKDGARLRKAGIEQFQRDHNLTIDGLVGKATLAALSREVEARQKSKLTATTGMGGGAVGVGDEVTGLFEGWLSMLGSGVVLVSLIFMAWLMFHYRDVVAAGLRPHLPKTAQWLWSF